VIDVGSLLTWQNQLAFFGKRDFEVWVRDLED
jgi:hypothetical protein